MLKVKSSRSREAFVADIQHVVVVLMLETVPSIRCSGVFTQVAQISTD
jgi:hypothetical protein